METGHQLLSSFYDLIQSAHRGNRLHRGDHTSRHSKVLIRFTLIAFVVTQSIQLSKIVPGFTGEASRLGGKKLQLAASIWQ